MIYHIIAFVCGFLIDLILGDPYCFPHPIRLIGKLISWLERHLRTGKHDRRNGSILVILVLVVTTGVTVFLLALSYRIHPYLGVLVETIMTYQILATKCLRVESMKVYHSLKYEGLEEARKSVSMIVGRDTQNLSEAGVAKAAIDTVESAALREILTQHYICALDLKEIAERMHYSDRHMRRLHRKAIESVSLSAISPFKKRGSSRTLPLVKRI